MERGSGILLHISSLPSNYGIGTFGKEAYCFIRLLKKTKQKYWQFLPLSPTGYKDSPYQSFSTFALNPYFIDLDDLIQDQLLKQEEVDALTWYQTKDRVDYGLIYENKEKILWLAYQRGYAKYQKMIQIFMRKNQFWLEDYALFMALKKYFHQQPWTQWEIDYKIKKKNVIHRFQEENQDWIQFYIFCQFIAFKQYQKLKNFAKANKIQLIGDCPIYVNFDSCDVWANQRLFLLDTQYYPTLVAGVPPDYFSKTGQLWGNPIYNYEQMKKDDYHWWTLRFQHLLKLYDYVRLDHFRGFEAYYAIPFKETTALHGKWYAGPGKTFFDLMTQKFGQTPFIAEDLGIITDAVQLLKDCYHFPGLKILLFAFDSLDEKHPYLPKNYEKNCIGYIGTHDNSPFFEYVKQNQNGFLNMKKYYQTVDENTTYEAIMDDLFASDANVIILQIQDILKQDEKSRMNVPGSDQGNWQYRITHNDFDFKKYEFIVKLTIKHQRD